MRLPILLLLGVTLLAGCTAATGTPITEEARCRQTGGVWRTGTNFCESGSGGGGY
jgi:hypothetical protein